HRNARPVEQLLRRRGAHRGPAAVAPGRRHQHRHRRGCPVGPGNMAADTGSTTGTDIDHGPTGDTGGTGPNGPDRDRGREIGREITVAVIDDHPAVAAGIQAWYAASDPPIRVVASGSTAQTAWLPPGRDADVVVLDLLLAPDHPECYG